MDECKICDGEITINHIIFHCPISHELWFTFDHNHNLTIPPLRIMHNHCLWRNKGNSKTSPVLTQLELLHLYHVWVVWWSLQKAPNNHSIIHPHSWIRRVLTCYFCMHDPTLLCLVTTHNSISGRMEEVASCRQVIDNSTQ